VRREFSAGGVVVRRIRGEWRVAAIRPGGKPEGTWALPKGLVDAGEDPAATALREVREETGLEATPVEKLGDIRYWYARDGDRVMKIVSFFLFRYRSGKLADHDHEVEEALWIPLEEAPERLAYKSEKEIAQAALSRLVPGS
jgi:ADP-ribose pyrophosphatase YjhB (NUDIX family)